MRIGIITFHNVVNYGGVLQCYALQQKLKEWGNDNPTAKQIRELVDKVMADEKNHLHWERDNYTVIIEPEQKIRICKPEE